MYKKIKEKIVITGASGYIGSILSKNLSNKYEIILIDKKYPEFKSKYKFIKLDLTDHSKVSKIFRDIKPDTIVHLAAQSTIDMVKLKKKILIKKIIF